MAVDSDTSVSGWQRCDMIASFLNPFRLFPPCTLCAHAIPFRLLRHVPSFLLPSLSQSPFFPHLPFFCRVPLPSMRFSALLGISLASLALPYVALANVHGSRTFSSRRQHHNVTLQHQNATTSLSPRFTGARLTWFAVGLYALCCLIFRCCLSQHLPC